MAHKQADKGKKPMSPPGAPPVVEPVLGRSREHNDEAMDKVRPMLASSYNEWGEMVAWPASRTRMARAATEVPIFIDALWAGLIPPFSAFLNVVLEHYQNHMLHLDPQSVSLFSLRFRMRSPCGYRSFGGPPPPLLLTAPVRPSAMLGVRECRGKRHLWDHKNPYYGCRGKGLQEEQDQ